MLEEEDLTPTTLQEFVALCPQKVSKWLMTVMEDANKDLHWRHSQEDRKEQLQQYIMARTNALPYLNVYRTIVHTITI